MRCSDRARRTHRRSPGQSSRIRWPGQRSFVIVGQSNVDSANVYQANVGSPKRWSPDAASALLRVRRPRGPQDRGGRHPGAGRRAGAGQDRGHRDQLGGHRLPARDQPAGPPVAAGQPARRRGRHRGGRRRGRRPGPGRPAGRGPGQPRRLRRLRAGRRGLAGPGAGRGGRGDGQPCWTCPPRWRCGRCAPGGWPRARRCWSTRRPAASGTWPPSWPGSRAPAP